MIHICAPYTFLEGVHRMFRDKPAIRSYIDELSKNQNFLKFMRKASLSHDLERKLGLCSELVALEWNQFDQVKNLGSRANCQDNLLSFLIMRLAQYLPLPIDLIESLIHEHTKGIDEGRNLVEEKYARMMRETDPKLFNALWRDRLETASPVKTALLESVIILLQEMQEELEKLKSTNEHARPKLTQGNNISALAYMKSELESYSYASLRQIHKFLSSAEFNYIEEIYMCSVLLKRCLDHAVR